MTGLTGVALLESDLLRRALLEAVLVGGLCGVVGVHVVLRRLPFFTLALSHAALPGVVVASLAGASLFLGSLASSLLLVVVVAVLGSERRLDTPTVTGVALAGALALGVLLQSAQAGSSRDLTAFLVGSIVTVGRGDVVLTAGVGLAVVVVLAALHKELVLGAFDRDHAGALGYRPLVLDVTVLAVVALTVATSVRAVGTVLVVALLVTPPLAARLWVDRVVPMMALGAGMGAMSGVAGMVASTQWRVAAGGAIALAATAVLVLSAIGARLVHPPSPTAVSVSGSGSRRR